MCGNRQPDKGSQRKNNVSKIPHAYYGCQKNNLCSIKSFPLGLPTPSNRQDDAVSSFHLALSFV
jgi:hypothetical protein